jgi:hypothetical protein
MKKYCDCKNVKDKKYHGGENTPLGKGFHASGYDEGKKKKGNNGDFYVVKEDKNGNKRWIKDTRTGTAGIDMFPSITN